MISAKSYYKEPLLMLAGAGSILLFPLMICFFQEFEHVENAQSLCPFMMLTGFPCPGCGITKSLIFLYQGDFQKSISYHLFGPAAGAGCIAIICITLTEMMTGKKYFRKSLYDIRIAYLLGGSLALYHLTRLLMLLYNNSMDDILRASVWK